MLATGKAREQSKEKQTVQPQLRCDACHRPIAEERAICAYRQSDLDGGVYEKVLVSSSGGEFVFLGTTCARKYGIVYTEDDL